MAENYALPNRQYVGARYVPKFSNPIAWDINRSYEPLTIVTYLNNSYTSKVPVPVGVDITNEEYWVVTGNYNAQVEEYRQAVEGVKNDMAELEENLTNQLNQKLVYLTPEMFGAKGDGVSNDYTAFKQMLDYANSIAKEVIINGSTIKDFRNIKFVFSKLYAIGAGIQIGSIINLTFDGLNLIGIRTSVKTALITLNPTCRYTKFVNCTFDGNFGANNCVLLKGYCINATFTNCLFKQFKQCGLQLAGTSTGKVQEIRVDGCTFYQYEYNDYINPDIPKEPTGSAIVGTEYATDNTIINTIISNCITSILTLKGGPDYIIGCHFYSELPVRLYGAFQVCDECYMDGTFVEVHGRNSIKNCLFAGTQTSKFIVLTEPKATNWRYEASAFINNQFRNLQGEVYNPNAFTSNQGYTLQDTSAYTDGNYFEWVTSDIQINTTRTNLPLLKDFIVDMEDNTDVQGKYKIGNMLIQYGTVTGAEGNVSFPVQYDYFIPQVIMMETENVPTTMANAFAINRGGFAFTNGNAGKAMWMAFGRSRY